MKATGIIRRVDDLGRIVIPKELRKTNGIREGDPMEIYVGENREIIFRKYNNNLLGQIDTLLDDIGTYCDVDDMDVDKALRLLEDVREIISRQ